jgi:hypothetical protein
MGVQFRGRLKLHRTKAIVASVAIVSAAAAPYVGNRIVSAFAATTIDSCGYPTGSSPALSATTFNESTVVDWAQVNGVGASATVSVFSNDESGILLGVSQGGSTVTPFASTTLAAPGLALSGQTTLSQALVLNQSYTTIQVSATNFAITNGDTLTLKSGSTSKALKAVGNFPAGSTTITVQSFTANLAYPVGSTVTDAALSYTSVPVAALPFAVAANDSITIGSNLKVTAVAPGAAAGATSIPVKLFKNNASYAAGTVVSDAAVVNEHVASPAVGTANLDPAHRPQYPALFLTRVPAGTAANTQQAGDWQQGPTPNGNLPGNLSAGVPFVDDVFGQWATATQSGSTYSSVQPSASNGWNLGPGSDTPTNPGGFANLNNEGHGNEMRWNVSNLHDYTGATLTPGTYKVQIMTHDGDQNNTGGDVGEVCAILTIPGTPTLNTTITSVDPNGGTSTGQSNAGVIVPVGSQITDTASIPATAGLGNATGTIDFKLYSPSSSCTTTPVFSDLGRALTNANPAVATSSPAYTVSNSPGVTYTWQDKYHSTSSNYLDATEACGTETVTTADARVILTPQEATNAVGNAHTFTATLQLNADGTHWTTITDDGATITFTLGPSGNHASFVNGNTCTTTNGSCTVQVNDSTAETITLHASSTFGAGDEGVLGTFTRATGSTGCTVSDATCDAVKHWVDARITLTPQSATNIVGNAHTFTATLQYTTDGTTWTTLTTDGDTINFTLPAPAGSATFVGGVHQCTTTAGSCSVSVNDSVAETITVHATSTFNAGGATEAFTRSTGGATCTTADATCDASKTFVKPGTTLTVSDQLTGLPPGATGTVTYTAYDNNSCSSGQLFTETDTIVTAGTAPSSQSITVGPGQSVFFKVVYTGSGTGNFGTFTSPCTAETASSS